VLIKDNTNQELEVWTPGQDSLTIPLIKHGIRAKDFKLDFGSIQSFEEGKECQTHILVVHSYVKDVNSTLFLFQIYNDRQTMKLNYRVFAQLDVTEDRYPTDISDIFVTEG